MAGQTDPDTGNNTINSILRDCKELSLSQKRGVFSMKPQHDDMTVLNDISNIGFNQKASARKAEANFSLTSDGKAQCSDSFLGQKTKTTEHKQSTNISTTVNQANLSIRSLCPERDTKTSGSRIMRRSKSPLTACSKSYLEEEFSKLFGGEDLFLKKSDQFSRNKKTHSGSTQMTLVPKASFYRAEDIPAGKENQESACDFVKTSCFGGNISVVTMRDKSRDQSKEAKKPTPKGLNSNHSYKQKEMADRSINFPRYSSKSRGSSYIKARENSKQKANNITNLQDITSLEIESSVQSSEVEMYVPKGQRKKRRDNSVMSKVDHRRDKSQTRGSPSTAILDKQFKSAKIESFESVMQNLKACHSKLR